MSANGMTGTLPPMPKPVVAGSARRTRSFGSKRPEIAPRRSIGSLAITGEPQTDYDLCGATDHHVRRRRGSGGGVAEPGRVDLRPPLRSAAIETLAIAK